MKSQITLIHPSARIPVQKPGSIGYDVYSVEDSLISSNTEQLIGLGIVVKPPEGYYTKLYTRSSTSFMLVNSVGIIDPNYCGKNDELKIKIFNHHDYDITIPKGNRIAQLVFEKIIDPVEFEIVNEAAITAQDRGGYGSTGTT